jgi:hypothetical protein
MRLLHRAERHGSTRLARYEAAVVGVEAPRRSNELDRPVALAAGVGFEPTGRSSRPTVFKTAPFDRSGTPPAALL